MRERRLVVAGAVDDCGVTLVPQPVHAEHGPLETEVVVDFDDV